MNPLQKLASYGQAIWLDYFHRKLLDAELADLIEQDGLKGLTSNPKIFGQAFAETESYQKDIQLRAGQVTTSKELYEVLAVRDLQQAADIFRPLFDSTDGWHGFVSLEVDPRLAHDTEATVREARRLYQQMGRPNVFIKVPATDEGVPAIERLISEGVNVNVTLLFGLPRYHQVAEAFMTGLENRASRGESIDRVRSVASFFLSRIDSKVDTRLQEISKRGGDRAQLAKRLFGEVALASARLAYQNYTDLVRSERWQALLDKGARPQWLLWGSTSTKNPDFDELKYVEALIGPETVDTVPPKTLALYRERGTPKPQLPGGAERSQVVLEQLAQLGIDIDVVTAKLEAEGVEKFVRPFDELLRQLERQLKAA